MDEVDLVPFAKRKRTLTRRSLSRVSTSSAVPPCRLELPTKQGVDRSLEWTGLPRGVKFDPSDEDLLWHLLAKLGKSMVVPHPLINNFIVYLDDNDLICHTHPQNLPGFNQNGKVAFIFHKKFRLCDVSCKKCGIMCWKKVGESKPISIDGTYHGCKTMLVLFESTPNGDKFDKSNWLMHQYCLGAKGDEDDLVVSKIFYQHNANRRNNYVENMKLDNSRGSTLTEAGSAFALEKNYMEFTAAYAPARVSDSSTLKHLTIDETSGYDTENDSAESLSTTVPSPDNARDEHGPFNPKDIKSYVEHTEKDAVEQLYASNNHTFCNLVPSMTSTRTWPSQASNNMLQFQPNLEFNQKASQTTIADLNLFAYGGSFPLPGCSKLDFILKFPLSFGDMLLQKDYIKSMKICDSVCRSDNLKERSYEAATVTTEKLQENCNEKMKSDELVEKPYNMQNQNNLNLEVFPVVIKSEPVEICVLDDHQLGSDGTLSSPRLHYEPDNFVYSDDCSNIFCRNYHSEYLEMNKSMQNVKMEMDELVTDSIDHLSLRERMQLLFAESSSDFVHNNDVKFSHQTTLALGHDSVSLLSHKARPFSTRRKWKRSATSSVETALKEDAPGLLQILIDRGITIQEIKLYGNGGDDEAIDIPETYSFGDLEEILNKVFASRQSFLKFPAIRETRRSKTLYCLPCLISLIEQTRYLQFRKSPVEWGWCRELESFIFVFGKHNRIVLERPEYGYATYFFELVGILPVDWQIKRLVTAMKLTSCSRSNVMENRPLMVGKDLSEGDARVLEEYGWTPNTGLASMLNFYDRIAHDRRGECSGVEWRSRIRKQLLQGLNGGRTIPCSIPRRAMDNVPDLEYELLKKPGQLMEIKAE